MSKQDLVGDTDSFPEQINRHTGVARELDGHDWTAAPGQYLDHFAHGTVGVVGTALSQMDRNAVTHLGHSAHPWLLGDIAH